MNSDIYDEILYLAERIEHGTISGDRAILDELDAILERLAEKAQKKV